MGQGFGKADEDGVALLMGPHAVTARPSSWRPRSATVVIRRKDGGIAGT